LKDPPPEAPVVQLAESSVHIRTRLWITPPRHANALDLQDQVLAAIKHTLVTNASTFPSGPTRSSSTTRRRRPTGTGCASARGGRRKRGRCRRRAPWPPSCVGSPTMIITTPQLAHDVPNHRYGAGSEHRMCVEPLNAWCELTTRG
jgi:hypothetical protein